MYEELVEELRSKAEFLNVSDMRRNAHGLNLRNSFAEAMLKAADVIEELSNTKWISVKERLPNPAESDWVIGVASGKIGTVTYQNAVVMVVYDPIEEAWYLDSDLYKTMTVTYWMPLPEPPKEEK